MPDDDYGAKAVREVRLAPAHRTHQGAAGHRPGVGRTVALPTEVHPVAVRVGGVAGTVRT